MCVRLDLWKKGSLVIKRIGRPNAELFSVKPASGGAGAKEQQAQGSACLVSMQHEGRNWLLGPPLPSKSKSQHLGVDLRESSPSTTPPIRTNSSELLLFS